MLSKSELRRSCLHRLSSLAPDERGRIGRKLSSKLQALAEVKRARLVFAYAPMQSEPDLWPALEKWSLEGRLCLPRTVGELLEFLRVRELSALVNGRYGFMEPASGDLAVPGSEDVVIVPGLAFTRQGWRLGRGGGYYDRLLSKSADACPTIAPCYSWQLFDNVPTEATDRKIDLILTENELIRTIIQ